MATTDDDARTPSPQAGTSPARNDGPLVAGMLERRWRRELAAVADQPEPAPAMRAAVNRMVASATAAWLQSPAVKAVVARAIGEGCVRVALAMAEERESFARDAPQSPSAHSTLRRARAAIDADALTAFDSGVLRALGVQGGAPFEVPGAVRGRVLTSLTALTRGTAEGAEANLAAARWYATQPGAAAIEGQERHLAAALRDAEAAGAVRPGSAAWSLALARIDRRLNERQPEEAMRLLDAGLPSRSVPAALLQARRLIERLQLVDAARLLRHASDRVGQVEEGRTVGGVSADDVEVHWTELTRAAELPHEILAISAQRPARPGIPGAERESLLLGLMGRSADAGDVDTFAAAARLLTAPNQSIVDRAMTLAQTFPAGRSERKALAAVRTVLDRRIERLDAQARSVSMSATPPQAGRRASAVVH